MSMYTDFNLRVRIKPDAPELLIETLEVMVGDRDDTYLACLPRHELFAGDTRWSYMLRCSSHSSALPPRLVKGEDGSAHELVVSSSFKHYNDEIRKLFDWLKPHLSTGWQPEFIGTSIYEGATDPFVYWLMPDGSVVTTSAERPRIPWKSSGRAR